jgi:aminoglycoside phosphotransferase family enzyme/predicted kinase
MLTPYPFVNALLNPAFYPHAVRDIQAIETHLSWIILTGPYAYKLKKPLNLGFQDYTTLEKRKHYCELEVQYNQPLAGEIYRGIIPITGTHEAPCFQGDGPAIEYLIQMIQFDPNAGFNILADQGQLQPQLIKMLAKSIAHFHATQPSDIQTAFGNPESFLGPMKDNYADIKNRDHDPALLNRLQGIEDWALHQYETHLDLLQLRKSSGCIRACHGDLHLRNIVLYQEKPLIFDCIEFNERFRWIDVISDASFMSMDLSHHDLPELKSLFLNTYIEHTFDYAGVPLLPFYQVHRAMVRAKIALIQSQQKDKNSQEYLNCMTEFSEYIDLAESYTHAKTPTLTITMGPSGSGKSYYSQQWVTIADAFCLRSDVFRKHLFQRDPYAPTPTSEQLALYADKATQQVYALLKSTAENLLKSQQSVIIDAACLKHWQRQIFQNLAAELQIPFQICVFDVPQDILAKRLVQRQQESENISDATLDVLTEQLTHLEPLTVEEEKVAHRITITPDN